nr:ribosomal protein L23 [Incarvillea lutea]YP_010489239.1 ribosomal protein L23 [Incarvillea lutea]UWK23473.1 ribosomal protein L23 [Incarvillea lutea]UWK23474.1 ribosomal protein L23 [Incarvillea lutea]
MDGIKFKQIGIQRKGFGYWGKINRLLMSNQDQLGQN